MAAQSRLTTRRRQPRDRRRPEPRIRLTERDQALLAALARFRLARTRDLTQLFFHGVRADTAAVRLRRLFDASYLEVQAFDRCEQNHYQLGPRGRAWAEAHGIPAGRAPAGGRAHHLAIVSLWVKLAGLAQGGGGWRLELFRPDWELRKLGQRGRDLVIPDALAELVPTARETSEAPLRLALEVDLGTETIRTLRRKLGGYALPVDEGEGLFGWTDLVLVVVVDRTTPARQQALRQLLDHSSPLPWTIWQLDEPVELILEELFNAQQCLPLQPPLAVRGGGRG